MTPPADSSDGGAPTAAVGDAGRPSAGTGAEAASAGAGGAADESEESEDDEMVEALENLILEAYNNMQSDGEYIFLPEEVAQKLHRVATQMEHEDGLAESNAEISGDTSEDLAAQATDEHDDANSREEKPKATLLPSAEEQEAPENQPEPELEQDQRVEAIASPHQQEGEHTQEESAEVARVRKVRGLEAKAAEIREEKHKLKQQKRLPRVRSTENLFSELPSVPELDEEASSGPPSPSPPPSRSHSADSTPVLRPALTPPRREGSLFPAPPLISLNDTPSSAAASPEPIAQSPASSTPSRSDTATLAGRASTYAKRREAALKLKEDKKKRELRIREAARKQREDSKRQLEQAQQKDMEEKRERVRRIREERLHRRAGKGATPMSASAAGKAAK